MWRDLPTFTPEHVHGLLIKHHNTVKVLLGINPQVLNHLFQKPGVDVSVISTSQKILGFWIKLLPGDIVLADRGFSISDSVGLMQAQLHIPLQKDKVNYQNSKYMKQERYSKCQDSR